MYVLVTVLVALFFTLYLKWFKSRRPCLDVKRLDGKTVLITGEFHLHCFKMQTKLFSSFLTRPPAF